MNRDEPNTSHSLVLDLVGTGRRVLDVGCATGYLAEALTVQGNKVSGVELDPEAAEAARPFLERLVVGDVEHLDLVDAFGPGQFDVVVFADVLEHLKDPASVLSRSRPLLADGGFVVLSIPNVAHGSVRLALMKGRFEYRPVGLLDDTHLRFFTRDRVGEMLGQAGFVPVDARETTVDPFETEIPLKRSDYPPEVLEEIRSDPDSRVYQFVLRADPVQVAPGSEDHAAGGDATEVQRLRRVLAALSARAGTTPTRPVIGVLDPTARESGPEGGALAALRMAAVVQELRRRLAGFDVRAYALSPDPMVSELAEDSTRSLSPWGPDSASELRAEIDGLVLLPAFPSSDGGATVADIEATGVAVHRLDAGREGPDPLVLAHRLADETLLALRREYLAVTGQAPVGRPYLLCLPATAAGPDLDARVAPRRAVVRPDGRLVPVDLLALVASADSVVTDSPGVRALADGLGRPVVAGVAELDSAGTPALDPAREAERRDAAVSGADRMFDGLAMVLLEDGGSRLAGAMAEHLAALERQLATLEAVNAGLRQSLARERLVMASEVRRREQGPRSPDASWSGFNVERMAREVAAAHAHGARLQQEIDAIYATRTMRVLAPMRRAYRLVRRFVPRPS